MISSIFNVLFYKPFLNGLVFLINILPGHSVGLAVILLTLVVRFIIFPFTHKATKTQAEIKKIEPEINKIKKEYKDNQQEQAKKIMELYKEHGINPFSGFVTLFIQLPVVFALYKVFLAGVSFNSSQLYSFVSVPEIINTNFLWFINVTEKSVVLAILAGLSHFIQMQVMMPPNKEDKKNKEKGFKADLARSMSLQFKYVMPVVIFIIALKLSAAISLYWTTTNIFAIVHSISVQKTAKKLGENNDKTS